MRPVIKSNRVDVTTGSDLEFNPYGEAKSALIDELGSFCSYCEKYNSRAALHVEHIFGKKIQSANW